MDAWYHYLLLIGVGFVVGFINTVAGGASLGRLFARQPVARRHLIPYGILLKVSYCSVAGYHWLTAGIPGVWKPFLWADLVFLVLFVWAYRSLGRDPEQAF